MIDTSATLTLNFDTAGYQALVCEIERLAARSEKFRQAVTGLFESGAELICLKVDDPSTAAAGHILVRAQPSDGLRRLMAAEGTGDV